MKATEITYLHKSLKQPHMIFKHTQPKTGNDIKCNKDCMVRAVTIATNLEYGRVHKLMYDNGWRASRRGGKDWENQITRTLVDLGFSYERFSFPAVKGESRMTAKTLSKIDPEGKYIVRVSKHVSVLDGGVLLDTWDCSDKCVYFAWKINPQERPCTWKLQESFNNL